MILAGDEIQVQFAIVEVRLHLSGPQGSFASLRAVSLSDNAPVVIDRRPPQPIPVRSNAPPVRPGVLPSTGYLQNPWPGAVK